MKTAKIEIETKDGKQSLEISLNGGSPWYAYIWIDGKVYCLSIGGNGYTYKLKRPK